MKKYNPIRQLREELGLNQFDFGKLIGRSQPSIRAYEKSLESTPPEVIKKIVEIASERGFGDIALELSTEEWKVRTVIYPPAEFQEKAKKESTLKERDWRLVFDRLMSSGDQTWIAVMKALLSVFESLESAGRRGKRAGG